LTLRRDRLKLKDDELSKKSKNLDDKEVYLKNLEAKLKLWEEDLRAQGEQHPKTDKENTGERTHIHDITMYASPSQGIVLERHLSKLVIGSPTTPASKAAAAKSSSISNLLPVTPLLPKKGRVFQLREHS
jgi:hypothetical protein